VCLRESDLILAFAYRALQTAWRPHPVPTSEVRLCLRGLNSESVCLMGCLRFGAGMTLHVGAVHTRQKTVSATQAVLHRQRPVGEAPCVLLRAIGATSAFPSTHGGR
jgi:hypothetical protein